MTQTRPRVWETGEHLEHWSAGATDSAMTATDGDEASDHDLEQQPGAGLAFPPIESSVTSAAAHEDEERIRRRCVDLSCASAHMRRGNPTLAEPFYRRVLADVTKDDNNSRAEDNGLDSFDDRLAFSVEARLGLVEIDLTRLRDESAFSASSASGRTDRNSEEAFHCLLVRCRLLLRALSHAHAAQDALTRGGTTRRRLQLRLLLGSVDIKRRLIEARLQALLRQAVSGDSGANRSSRPRRRLLSQGGADGSGAGVTRGQTGNSFCNQEKRPAFSGAAVKRSPSLQQRQQQQQQLQRNRRRQRNASTLAEFVRRLREFLVSSADAEKAAATSSASAAAAAAAAASSSTGQNLETAKRSNPEPTSNPDQISVQLLDNLIGKFVEDSLQRLKDIWSPPRDLVVSSLRRDESGQHYLQFSQHYLTFAQSLVEGSGLRDDMEAAASSLLSDIRRQQLDVAMTELHQKLEGPASTLPVTGRERAAARLAHPPEVDRPQPRQQAPTVSPLEPAAYYDDNEVAESLKTLLRCLLDIAQADFESDQLPEAAELFEVCLDLCRSLSREVGDNEVERFEAPKIHRFLGAIHCRLGDKRRGVSMMMFAADLFEQRLREATPVDDEEFHAKNGDNDEDDDNYDKNSAEAGLLGLAETWYDIGCVLIGATGDGRCGDLLLDSLSDRLRRWCIFDLLLQLPSKRQQQQQQQQQHQSSTTRKADAIDALKAFARCRDLLLTVAKQRRLRRQSSRFLSDIEVRVTARLADCCFLANRLKRAQAHYEEALALLGGIGDVPRTEQSSDTKSPAGGGGGGRMIDHGHVLRMLGCSRLLLANNRSQAAAVLETSLIMFQHLAKVNNRQMLPATDDDDDGAAGGWDSEQLWVLTPLLTCHMASEHHPRALHCARLILANSNLTTSSSQRWLTFYANFSAGRAAKRLRDFSASVGYLELAATAARRGSDEWFGGLLGVARLLACLTEAEAAESAAADNGSNDEQVAGHYARLLQYLESAATSRLQSQQLQGHRQSSGQLPLIRSPALTAACMRGAEILHSAGRPEDSARLLETAARCSAAEDAEDAESLAIRQAGLALELGSGAMRAGQWDRALAHLKSALAACAKNPEGDVGHEAAPILAKLGSLHHIVYCLARRDILFEHAEVQDSRDRCAFNYLQSLQLAWSPDAALRLAGFLLTTGQATEAELCALQVENFEDDEPNARIEFESYEAPTLPWSLESVWPAPSTLAVSTTPAASIRPRRSVLAAAILASCCGCLSSCGLVDRLRKLLKLALATEDNDAADDRLLAALVMLHHGLAWEAAFLLGTLEASQASIISTADGVKILRVWSANLAIIDLAVTMVTAFCCLIHLTNALAVMRGTTMNEKSYNDKDETTQL